MASHLTLLGLSWLVVPALWTSGRILRVCQAVIVYHCFKLIECSILLIWKVLLSPLGCLNMVVSDVN